MKRPYNPAQLIQIVRKVLKQTKLLTTQPDMEGRMTYEHDRINDLEDRCNELLGVLRDIRDELEQANGGKGPNSVLSLNILAYVRAAIAKATGEK